MKPTDYEFAAHGGYFPGAPDIPPSDLRGTVKAGLNVWLRSMGKVEVGKGALQTSAQNVGARIFPFNTQRASLAGGLVGGTRMPYASVLRYENAAIFFLSELTGQQLYLDESALSGATTSTVAGRLRIAVPDGAGGYNIYDAGFDPPDLPSVNVTTSAGGTMSMNGSIGVALAAWRPETNAKSAPSAITYKTAVPSTDDLILVDLISPVSGQNGWILCGTRWGDLTGELRIVRYVYIVPRGTFTATSGSPTLTGNSETQWLQDARAGDVWTIGTGSYTISSVDSDNQITLTGNIALADAGSTQTATVTNLAAEWRNSDLGSLVSKDAFKPPSAAGVFQYASRVFLWGTFGADNSVTGPGITVMLPFNPEHHGLFNITTAANDDLINVIPGSQSLLLMTTNSLEIVTFTGRDSDPYKIRVVHRPGFRTPTAGLFFKDVFYGYPEKPVRTREDANMDVSFGAPVWDRMKDWDSSRVVLAGDEKNSAVLFCHYDGVSATEVVPYMVSLGVWGPPHSISGRVVDHSIVNGITYLILLTGGNYRVYQWEGGTGASGAYIVPQFAAAGGMSQRAKLKQIHFTGKASTLRVYQIAAGGAVPDVTSTGAADASFALTGTDISEESIFTNLRPARAATIRVEFPTDGSMDSLIASGYLLEGRQ